MKCNQIVSRLFLLKAAMCLRMRQWDMQTCPVKVLKNSLPHLMSTRVHQGICISISECGLKVSLAGPCSLCTGHGTKYAGYCFSCTQRRIVKRWMKVSKQCTQCSNPFSCYALCGFDEEESQTGEVEGEQAQAGVFLSDSFNGSVAGDKLLHPANVYHERRSPPRLVGEALMEEVLRVPVSQLKPQTTAGFVNPDQCI